MKPKLRWKPFKKRLEAREAAFKKMSKAEQRVALAKDVLAAIASGALVVRTRVYFKPMSRVLMDRAAHEDALDHPMRSDLRKVLFDGNYTCNVCAVGALFAAKVMRVDEEKLGSITHVRAYDGLREYFHWRQLEKMENYFEYPDDGNIAWALKYPKRDVHRLRAIMQNIVENGGDFKP